MITTRSSFYYGHAVTTTTQDFIIDEGIGEITVSVPIGSYSLTKFIEVVSNSLNDACTLSYSLTLDRSTRKITFSATGNFDMMYSSKPNNSLFSLLGITSDKTGLDEYESDEGSGKEYRPQFLLQDYESYEDNKSFIQAKVNESASGIAEIVSFGSLRTTSFNITLITDLVQQEGSPLENNQSAVQDTRDFFEYCVTKAYVEFMPDRSNQIEYTTSMLNSTPSNGKGIGYTLKNMTNKKLPYFYETGKVTFRKIEIL